MPDWIEQYHQSKREQQDQKGGPGSGHHGHAGRPGKVGGSAPGQAGGTSEEDEYYARRAGKPVIPTRTKIFTLIREEGITDPEELVQRVGIDEQWVRDLVNEQLEQEKARREPGIYVPEAVGWINRLDSSFRPNK